MSELPRSILGDLIVHQKGFPFKSRDYQDEGIPVVRVSNFTDDSIDTSDLKFVSENIASENQKVALRNDDVIIATVGSWPKNPASIVGKTICVPPEMDGALMNQNSVILRVKNNSSVDQKYLFIALKTKLFSEYLVSTAQGSANQASVTLSDIFSYEVEWPEKEIRESIVRVIDSMNQKIKLNRQTNQTLEQIAQAIFKSWFVDFDPVRAKIAAREAFIQQHPEVTEAAIRAAAKACELAAIRAISGKTEEQLNELIAETLQQLKATAALFPDAMVNSELGEVPEEWEFKPLSKLIELIGGGTPKKSEAGYWGGDIPWFSVKDAPTDGDVFVIDTEQKITELGLKKSSTKLLSPGTTIISARGTVGRLALVGREMAMNQSCYGVQGADGIGPYLNYFNLKEAVSELQQNTHGAVFDTITRDTFDTVSLVEPCMTLKNIFEEALEPLIQKIKSNLLENAALSATRDTLLPKLLSGELPVDDVA
ncbi:MAG: restriction endonuclease subunit S [Candidatus Thiodiazotropha lotti]|nr:restriction endonuclease subunit S [Candidatus Thiodiazotropha lotti]MCW4222487.1 restriction endonuclease subunit S [Candidatus Thiodiazotropha lotti]